MTAAQPSRPTPISYPIGAQHLRISARSTSRATDVLVRCVLSALLWYAGALLRHERRVAKAPAPGRAASRAARTGFLPIWID